MSESDSAALAIDVHALPRHVAIIMDGNGRWARQRGLPRIEGHRKGAESVREVVRAARAIGIPVLTLFAFSEQNWDRPRDEVDALMELLYRYVLDEREEILGNDIRLAAVGELERLPLLVREALGVLMKLSSARQSMVLCLALSYGGREDLARATRSIAERVRQGTLQPEQIDEALVGSYLATAGLPPVDLLIRTSGEMRLSNFLLWELAYAELLFTSTMWPDFRKPDLLAAVAEFQSRERRYGRTSAQLRPPAADAGGS
ncbi:MAG: di-trans,poly-cis-decaprenylcistransferase [Proteobacteria bacterium]|nr:di-trans,poly-cis-decaprenylcistransferase [Pseudomonadota bacterium]